MISLEQTQLLSASQFEWSSHYLLGLSFALLKSQIPRKEADWLSLGHMIIPCPEKARHLNDSFTRGKEGTFEKEIRVLHQKKEEWIPGGDSNHQHPSSRSQFSDTLSLAPRS